MDGVWDMGGVGRLKKDKNEAFTHLFSNPGKVWKLAERDKIEPREVRDPLTWFRGTCPEIE